MPGGDGTGPTGMGPMTGRAAGYCAGSNMPGFANSGFRGGFVGFGRGRGLGGGGWGRRNRYYATGLPGWARTGSGWPAGANIPGTQAGQQELDALKNQAQYLQDSLGQIQRRIDEIESRQDSRD